MNRAPRSLAFRSADASKQINRVWKRFGSWRRKRNLRRNLSNREFGCEHLEDRCLLAASPLGDESLINTEFTSGAQRTSATTNAVASRPSGEFVVAFSGKGAGDSNGVFAKLFAADGTPESSQFAVNSTTAGQQRDASVAMYDDGSLVIAWSGKSVGDSKGVVARRFASNGTPLGPELLVNTTTSGSQQRPVVEVAASGDFLIAWSGKGATDSNGVFFRRFDSAGNTLSDETPANVTTPGKQHQPSVAYAPDGSFLIAWNGRGPGDSNGVLLRRFDAAGNPISGEIQVNTTTSGKQELPEIAVDGSGNAVVVWSGKGIDDNKGVYLQRFDANGTVIGIEERVNTPTSFSQDTPTVAMASGGEFIIGWNSKRQDGSNSGVFAQEYDASGQKLGGEFQVNTTTSSRQQHSSVAMDDAGNYTFAWSGRGTGDNSGVLARSYAQPAPDLTPPDLIVGLANDTGASNSDGETSDPTISGNVSDLQSGVDTLVANVDGGGAVPVAIDPSGDFSFDPGLALDGSADGAHTVEFTATDNAGNPSMTDVPFVLDTLAPPAPTALALTAATDTGQSQSDGITSEASPEVTGDAVTSSLVHLSIDGTEVGQGTASSPWQISTGTLSGGNHTATATAEDAAGNLSGPSSPYSFETDLTLPNTPSFMLDPNFDSAPVGDTQTTFASVTLLGHTAPNMPVELVETAATTSSDGNGDFQFDNVPLAVGPNLLTARATDVAGNQREFSKTITRLAPNEAPIFDSVGPLSVMPGERLEVPLSATDPDGDHVSFSIDSADPLPTGILQGNGVLVFEPTPDEIGSTLFTLTASDGRDDTSQNVTLNVVADVFTTTRLSGFVLDTLSVPLVGVRVEVGGVQDFTAADGSFSIDFGNNPVPGDTLVIHADELAGPLTYPFIAEKLPLLLGHDVFDGVDNVISRPIYLPALDTANAVTIDPLQDTTVSTAAIPGMELFVAAGTLEDRQGDPFTGELGITEVPVDFTPAALPAGAFPDLVVTIQPGDMVFTQPAPLTFPNNAGWAPGMVMDLMSINPETGDFDDVGDLQVSADGTVVETISGGVRNSSWHYGRPPEDPEEPDENENNEDDDCEDCKDGGGGASFIFTHSGVLTEWHDLVTYQSLGETRGVTLTYDSHRADPRHIVHTGARDFDPAAVVIPELVDDLRLVAELTVQRGSFLQETPGFAGGEFGLNGGEHIWDIPDTAGDVDAALLVDLSDQPTGIYDYRIASGILLHSPIQDRFNGSMARFGSEILNVNSVEGPFGAGWGIDGLEQVVENPNGSILLVDGDGGELQFEPETSLVRDLVIQDAANQAVSRYHGTTGVFVDQFVAPGAGGLNQPHNPTFGPDGRLYVVSGGTQQILRFNGQTGAFLDVFVDSGEGGFAGSSELLFDAAGSLYAASATTAGVHRYDSAGNHIGNIAGPADGVGAACGIEIGPDGNLYVYDTSDEEMRRFDPATGNLIDVFIPSGNLVNACDFDFGPNGDIFITDVTFGDVRRFSGADGTFLGTFAATGGFPSGITLGPDDNFYVNVTGNTHRFGGQTGAFIDAFVLGNGGFVNFFPPVAGDVAQTYTSPPGDFTTLERLADGTWRRTAPDQMVSLYDVDGRLTSMVDRNGNQTLYEYNVDGHIERITDPVGLETVFTYTDGRVSSITDPALRTTQLDYDADGNLTRITDPDGTFREFRYDADHHMTGETDKRGNVEQALYDFAGRVDRTIRKDGSVVDFSPVQVRGLYPADATTDALNALETFGDFSIQTTIVDGNGNTTFRTLDRSGQLVSQSDEVGPLPTIVRDPATNLVTSVTDARGNTTSFTYDSRGNMTSIEDPINLGTPRVSTYDPTFSQLTGFTDELGRQALFDVDPLTGNTLSVTRVVGSVGGGDDVVTQMTYTAEGLVDTVTDPLGRVSDVDYDAFGRIVRVTFAQGTSDEATQHFEYDAAGNRTAFVDENGNRTEFSYDALDWLIQITESDPDAAGPLTSPITTLTYDDGGNLQAITDARNNTTTVEYDRQDRQTRIVDALSNETHFVWDEADNLVSRTDPNGNQTQFVYDARNRRSEMIDPDGGVTTFAYDLDNNLISLTDPVINQTQFAYDARNRLTGETDPLGGLTTWLNDPVDNLTSMTDRNGRVTQYTYDDLNRLTSETWVGGGSVIQYTYDAASNIISASDSFSSLAYTHDDRDRTLTVDNAGTPDAPRVVLTYTYDDAGNILSVSDTIDGAAGGVNAYQYDGLNRTIELTQTGNNVTDKRVDFVYDSLGQFESIKRFRDPAGLQLVVDSTFTFDALNRLESLTHENASDTVAFTDLTYDAAGRVTQITNTDGTTTYTHDDRDQLTGADHTDAANPDESYLYDANGNRVASHLHNSDYVTGPNNRLVSDGTFTYEYDAEGNMIQRTEVATGDLREFEWDHRNRLIALIDWDSSGSETQRVEFTYDAFDRRVSKRVLDATDEVFISFVYDRDDVLLDFLDNDGTAGPNVPSLSRRYLHGPAVDQVLAQDDGTGNVLWHLTDHLGTVTDLVDNNGTVLNHLRYDSFGNVIDQSDATAHTRYRFTGREFDSETDLHYYRARYYDGAIGRFVSEDPIGFAGGHQNLFSYVGNRPLDRTDPTGQNAFEQFLKACEEAWKKHKREEAEKRIRERLEKGQLPDQKDIQTLGENWRSLFDSLFNDSRFRSHIQDLINDGRFHSYLPPGATVGTGSDGRPTVSYISDTLWGTPNQNPQQPRIPGDSRLLHDPSKFSSSQQHPLQRQRQPDPGHVVSPNQGQGGPPPQL